LKELGFLTEKEQRVSQNQLLYTPGAIRARSENNFNKAKEILKENLAKAVNLRDLFAFRSMIRELYRTYAIELTQQQEGEHPISPETIEKCVRQDIQRIEKETDLAQQESFKDLIEVTLNECRVKFATESERRKQIKKIAPDPDFGLQNPSMRRQKRAF